MEQIITDGGYDYDLSMDALVNYAQSSAGYDVSYILAAYSASLQQKNTSKEDMLSKLRAVSGSMFPVSSEADEGEHLVPLTYSTYKSVTLTVVTQKTQIGSVNGSPIYRYTTARRTYYEPDETFTSSEPVSVTTYTPVTVDIPIYSGTKIISSFASWLKISPMRLQFKSITRRADSDRHVSMVREDLEHEENPQCRALGEDYISLIKDVGNREALTRRFFLIFQYPWA